MNKTEIMEYLLGVKPEDALNENDQVVLDSLKSMERIERLNTLCEIMDEVEIDLDTKVMAEVRENHTDELYALRKANNRDDGTEDVSAKATSERALKILEVKS